MLWAQAYLIVCLRFSFDIFMENGDLIPFKIWQERDTKPKEYIIWHALVNKISVLKKKMKWNHKSTVNENVFTSIYLCINDGTSTIMFLHSTTKIVYQCLVSCMYNLGEVTPSIFNSLSIRERKCFYATLLFYEIPNYNNFNSKRLMPVHFVELNVKHYYIYFGVAVTQLIFGVKLRSGGSRKRGEFWVWKKDCIFVGHSNFTDLQNHILIFAKYCMYAARCNNRMPSVQLFVAKVYIH